MVWLFVVGITLVFCVVNAQLAKRFLNLTKIRLLLMVSSLNYILGILSMVAGHFLFVRPLRLEMEATGEYHMGAGILLVVLMIAHLVVHPLGGMGLFYYLYKKRSASGGTE